MTRTMYLTIPTQDDIYHDTEDTPLSNVKSENPIAEGAYTEAKSRE